MVATRFSVALHILLLIANDAAANSTSARLAWSIGTNPVVVRRISGQLARAGLITVQRGPGGASLTRPPATISLRDIWRAIHPEKEQLLRVHGRTNQTCPVGRRVPDLLRQRFDSAESAMLENMAHTSLADMVGSVRTESGDAVAA